MPKRTAEHIVQANIQLLDTYGFSIHGDHPRGASHFAAVADQKATYLHKQAQKMRAEMQRFV
jgi:hypothetical protein